MRRNTCARCMSSVNWTECNGGPDRTVQSGIALNNNSNGASHANVWEHYVRGGAKGSHGRVEAGKSGVRYVYCNWAILCKGHCSDITACNGLTSGVSQGTD